MNKGCLAQEECRPGYFLNESCSQGVNPVEQVSLSMQLLTNVRRPRDLHNRGVFVGRNNVKCSEVTIRLLTPRKGSPVEVRAWPQELK